MAQAKTEPPPEEADVPHPGTKMGTKAEPVARQPAGPKSRMNTTRETNEKRKENLTKKAAKARAAKILEEAEARAAALIEAASKVNDEGEIVDGEQ